MPRAECLLTNWSAGYLSLASYLQVEKLMARDRTPRWAGAAILAFSFVYIGVEYMYYVAPRLQW